MNSSADLYKLINAYKNRFDPNMSIKDVMNKFDDIRAGFFNKDSDKIYETPDFDVLKTYFSDF